MIPLCRVTETNPTPKKRPFCVFRFDSIRLSNTSRHSPRRTKEILLRRCYPLVGKTLQNDDSALEWTLWVRRPNYAPRVARQGASPSGDGELHGDLDEHAYCPALHPSGPEDGRDNAGLRCGSQR